MAKYDSVLISSGLSSDVINYLVSLNPSRFTKVSDTEMTIDNRCTFSFEWATNWNAYLIKDSTTLLTLSSSTYGGSLSIMSIISDNFIYIRWTRNRNGAEDLPVILIIATDDNNYLYGGTNNSNVIYDITFNNMIDNTSGYKFNKLINFTAPVNTIGYSSIAPISSTGQTLIFPKDVWSCSTMSLFTTLSLPNGKLFITIGTNNMVELDT